MTAWGFVQEQERSRIRVAVVVEGDIDGLGPRRGACEGWLDFEGIVVHFSDAGTLEQRAARLAELTDISALTGMRPANGARLRLLPALDFPSPGADRRPVRAQRSVGFGVRAGR